MNLPKLGEQLAEEHIKLLNTFSKSCRHTIVSMLKQSQSGHPGGSLSTIDYLALLYTMIIGQTGEKVIVSNGHISPAVYSTLAEMGWIPKQEVIDTFRNVGSIYEGHVTRHVPGIWYGTGPLGSGISAASGFALAEKLKGSNQTVYGIIGDGEAQEGQVHEMMNFAVKYNLDNFVVFVDYNKVQLTDSLEDTMPINIAGIFEAAGWHVIDVDGHDYSAMWSALKEAQDSNKPVIIMGNTIMGKGVDFMEETGLAHKATWHGKAPAPDAADEVLPSLLPTEEETQLLDQFRSKVAWTPPTPTFIKEGDTNNLDTGEPKVYEPGTVTDCRSAYGNALLDLAKRNKQVLALTADLMGSVKTQAVHDELPNQHVEAGIAEQHMVSLSGGLSLDGFVPFCSTFGAFMSSRAKDQARVNDINHANVKMVATHCGLSVGEDGPTHQAIDDMGSFLGMFNMHVIEPADANQCDQIIRYVAKHDGNFYVRMGRHKFEVLTKEDGTLVYGPDYVYEYGKTDTVREGSDLTVVASGAMVGETLKALEQTDKSVEVIAVSSIKKFDQNLIDSIKKTGKVITVEDHNTISGLGGMLARELMNQGICPQSYEMIGVEEYQLSGTQADLYEEAGISANHIAKAINSL